MGKNLHCKQWHRFMPDLYSFLERFKKQAEAMWKSAALITILH